MRSRRLAPPLCANERLSPRSAECGRFSLGNRRAHALIAAISGATPMVFHYARDAVSQYVQRHRGGDLRRTLHQEMRGAHTHLQRAERMLDCSGPLGHLVPQPDIPETAKTGRGAMGTLRLRSAVSPRGFGDLGPATAIAAIQPPRHQRTRLPGARTSRDRCHRFSP